MAKRLDNTYQPKLGITKYFERIWNAKYIYVHPKKNKDGSSTNKRRNAPKL